MTSAEVREQILDSLILDIVGPVAGLKADTAGSVRARAGRRPSMAGESDVRGAGAECESFSRCAGTATCRDGCGAAVSLDTGTIV